MAGGGDFVKKNDLFLTTKHMHNYETTRPSIIAMVQRSIKTPTSHGKSERIAPLPVGLSIMICLLRCGMAKEPRAPKSNPPTLRRTHFVLSPFCPEKAHPLCHNIYQRRTIDMNNSQNNNDTIPTFDQIMQSLNNLSWAQNELSELQYRQYLFIYICL